MVNIRYLNKDGDETKMVTVQEAKDIFNQEFDNPKGQQNVIFDEDEKRIVTKATMGQLRADGNYTVFPIIRGG